jgi:hypothetical protein
MKSLKNALLGTLAALLAATAAAQAPKPYPAGLKGDYAFTFNGFSVDGNASRAFDAVGRFTADGAGQVTNGELDANSANASAVYTAARFQGRCAVGADRRGLLTFALPGARTASIAFMLAANGSAQIVKFEGVGGARIVGTGSIEKIDTSAYQTAALTGDYALGLSGFDAANSRTAFAGRFTANGAGVFIAGAADLNEHGVAREYGASKPVAITVATYAVSDGGTGRGSIKLAGTIGGSDRNFNFVFYVVNADTLFAMRVDAIGRSTALLNGLVLRQRVPPEGFSDASWAGTSVIYLTARTTCGSGSRLMEVLEGFFTAACGSGNAPVPVVLAGLLSADGRGGVSITFDQNCGGVHQSVTNLSGTYQVARNGRTAIDVGAYAAVAYLVGPQQGFLLGTDSSGFVQGQSAQAFGNGVLNGSYAAMTATPASPDALILAGEFSAQGADSLGKVTAGGDRAGPAGKLAGSDRPAAAAGAGPHEPFTATYSISSSPVNGRGVMTLNTRSQRTAIVYVVSPTEFVAVPLNDRNPAVWIFQQ